MQRVEPPRKRWEGRDEKGKGGHLNSVAQGKPWGQENSREAMEPMLCPSGLFHHLLFASLLPFVLSLFLLPPFSSLLTPIWICTQDGDNGPRCTLCALVLFSAQIQSEHTTLFQFSKEFLISKEVV